MAAMFICELEPVHDVGLDSTDPYIQKLVRDGLKDPDAYDWLFVDSEVTIRFSRFLYERIYFRMKKFAKTQKPRNLILEKWSPSDRCPCL